VIVTSEYRFNAVVWRWKAQTATWMFVTLPNDISDQIDDAHSGIRAGFGSVKVRVRIGDSDWTTSIFPSREQGGFILPVKKAVRVAQGLSEGSTPAVVLTTLV
jgi:hypothetical protein